MCLLPFHFTTFSPRLYFQLSSSLQCSRPCWLPASWMLFHWWQWSAPAASVRCDSSPSHFKRPWLSTSRRKGTFSLCFGDFTWANVSWQRQIQPTLASLARRRPNLWMRDAREERRAFPRGVCVRACIPAVKHARCRKDPSGVVSVAPDWWCILLMTSWMEASCLQSSSPFS